MIYYVSDTHFHHTNIIEYCNRPFHSVDEMNSEMIRRWNSVVKPEDTVYHLGDFALSKSDTIIPLVASLNGLKHFVYGNHDSLGPHRKADWISINKDLYIEDFYKDKKMIIWLNHFPYTNENPYNPKHTRTQANRNWDLALCGHVHNAWRINAHNCINVGVDCWDFYPRTLEHLIEKSGWSGKIKI